MSKVDVPRNKGINTAFKDLAGMTTRIREMVTRLGMRLGEEEWGGLLCGKCSHVLFDVLGLNGNLFSSNKPHTTLTQGNVCNADSAWNI